MQALRNRVVILTGASSGIGEATAVRLARAGASLAIFARRPDRLETLARQLEGLGAAVAWVAGDVTADSDRKRLVSETLGRFGRIDALVNNAGYGQRGPVELVPIDAIRRNFETNVFGLLALTQEVVPHLRRSGGGRIINIGSVAGRIARPMTSVYDATKHAIEAFSSGLRGELKPFGIQVVLIRPGFILSEFVSAADAASAGVLANPGPYAPYVRSFQGSARKLHSIAGRPEDVARVVERALAVRSPKTHYAVPGHARFFLALQWALPARALDWFVRLRT